MDSYTDCFDKHLINFTKFAGQFTKVFIPIIGTAVKMSTQEPVSAYSIYKAAKDLSDNKKKSKKNRKNSSKSKTVKSRVHKLASAPAASNRNTDRKLNKTKNVGSQGKAGSIKNKPNTNKTKYEKNVLQKKQKTADATPLTHRFLDSEINGFVNQLHTDDSRETVNSLQKKKGLVEQLEKGTPDSDESFETVELEDLYFDPKIYLDEFSINNKINSSQSNVSPEEELSNTSEDDGEAAEALANSTACKSNRKRKSPEGAPSKAICNNDVINVTSESKKSKKLGGTKTVSRKSLSAGEESSRRRSRDDNSKKLATKSATNVSTVANVKLVPLSTAPNVVKSNSIEEGKRAFKWLLNPVIVDDFFAKFWEQKACLIKRQQSDYFGHLISFEMIDQMLLKNHVEFTKNIDVTSYKNGFRETLNPEGRAFPPVVWDHYGQGCSIRLLNPQTFLPPLFALSTTMQEYFQCLVGANAYLTPPNSQGFAPHYDDIEAIVLQIEGRKRWKLYKPRSTTEMLPRYSSRNFTQEEIGKPVMEEVLEPGDVLYFPRGTIHQACTEPGYHSLHITLSVYQKQSFADLFEKMLPAMLQKAIATNVEMRSGLPLYAWQHAGIAFSENSTKERADFTKKVTRLVHKSIRDMPLQEIMDAAMDQLAKKFQHEALPPHILPEEKLRTVFGSNSRTNERGECVCDYDIDERTNLRLLRANILRLVEEEGKMRIYYYLDNSKEYCEYEPNFIEIEAMEAASIEVLIKSYPQYVGVSQLPLPSNDKKINLATALWERGLLMMEKPFR